MFVTFEGVDGSGKTTQVELLRSHLAEQGRDVVATREPGGTPLGERVRELLLDGPEMAPWAEAALFAAARAELAERLIRPALARGADVVSDRYIDSSLAYQGIARRLGLERVLELNLLAIGDLLPDRTFVLDVEPGLAAGRVGETRDRIESETDDFRSAVAEGYRSLEAVFPQRVRVLDGSRPASEIARAVRGELAALV
jgi:dTMP kinase